MANTPNAGAPLWTAAQGTPWLTENQAHRIWDAFAVSVIVESMSLTAPPGACADGARYLVHGTATGAWAGEEGHLAIAVGANASNGWQFATIALQGQLLYNRADSTNYRYESGVWAAFADSVSRFQDLLDVSLTGLVDGDVFVWDASNGVLFPLTVSGLVAPLLAAYVQATLDADGTLAANSDLHVATQKAIRTYVAAAIAGIGGATLDTDGSLGANSDARIASQKAVKTYVDASVSGLLDLKGGQDCSANPNYPAALKGDYYFVTVAGRIGGGAGTAVGVGDVIFATADNAGGTQAAVGASWDVLRTAAGIVTGVSRLHDLTDVDLTGLADGLVLKYDASNGSFYFAQDLGWPFASASDYRAGQESGKAIAPDQVWAAAAYVALADAATIAVDFSTFINAKVTLGGNRTLGAPINMKEGQTGLIAITQDGTGTRTLAYNAAWKFASATAPVLSTAAAARDLLFYQVLPGAATVYGTLVKAV